MFYFTSQNKCSWKDMQKIRFSHTDKEHRLYAGLAHEMNYNYMEFGPE